MGGGWFSRRTFNLELHLNRRRCLALHEHQFPVLDDVLQVALTLLGALRVENNGDLVVAKKQGDCCFAK